MVSIEISLYPLQEDYVPAIRAFIERLQMHSQLKVLPNTMSTQVFGPYQETLEIVSREMALTHQCVPKAPFVLKVLHGDLSPE